MSLQAAMFIAIGGQIGSGWLFAALSAAGVAGPSAVLSWVIGGALTLVIALAWMEVGTALPFSGAIVRYPYLSHGGLTGWILGLSYWLANVSLPAIEAIAAITYVGGLFPDLGLLTTVDGVSMLSWPRGILVGLAMMVFFLLINLFGVKLLSEANRWVTWWKIIIPTVTFLMLFFVFRAGNFTDYGFFGNGGGSHSGFSSTLQAVAVSGIAFAMMGFRGVIDFAGEVKNPKRNIPLGTVGSVLIPLGIYIGLQVALIGALDWADAGVAAGDWSALEGSTWADGPLNSALKATGMALLGAFVSVLLLDAILSPSAAGYLYLGGGARVGYGLATNKYFPRALTSMNKHGIPVASAVVAFVVGCSFFAPAPSWYRLVGFISSALVLSTLAASVALMVWRRTAPDLVRPYRLPAARVLAPAGFLAASLIIYWCGFVTLVNLITILLGALCVYAVCFSTYNGWVKRGPAALLATLFLVGWIFVAGRSGFVLAAPGTTTDLSTMLAYLGGTIGLCIVFLAVLRLLTSEPGVPHLRGGYWLVFQLLALLTLGGLGSYGPLDEPILAFPWDILAAMIVSLIAYFWAVATGFAPPEMTMLEAESVAAAELEAAGDTEGAEAMKDEIVHTAVDPLPDAHPEPNQNPERKADL
ncbi:MAG: APC family permease [Gordonia sp. (in: high G+C Gram-positive bacteria)]|uniref:APC family permease n=1 Tax=Gordonia sp. (in: high G+C Gram-positive bacteria) TaxID=84139 RepID=UPI0039E54C7C